MTYLCIFVCFFLFSFVRFWYFTFLCTLIIFSVASSITSHLSFFIIIIIKSLFIEDNILS